MIFSVNVISVAYSPTRVGILWDSTSSGVSKIVTAPRCKCASNILLRVLIWCLSCSGLVLV